MGFSNRTTPVHEIIFAWTKVRGEFCFCEQNAGIRTANQFITMKYWTKRIFVVRYKEHLWPMLRSSVYASISSWNRIPCTSLWMVGFIGNIGSLEEKGKSMGRAEMTIYIWNKC